MSDFTRRHVLATAGATVLAGGAAGALAAPSAAASSSGRRSRRRVVLIDIDGFDPRFLAGRYAEVHPLPRIRELRSSGASGTASATFSSYSNSCRTSTATGTYPSVHRNTGYYLDADGTAITQERYIEPGVETIAQALRRQDRTGAYVQWYAVQDYGAGYGDLEQLYTQPGGSITARVDDAIALLSGEPVDSGGEQVAVTEPPDLLTVYASDVDGHLHDNGFAGAGLVDALQETDTQVGRLLDAIGEHGLGESTTVILTGDHGLREWTRPLLPDLVATLEETGSSVESVTAGGNADPDAEIVVYGAPRTADVTFRSELSRRELRRLIRRIERLEGVAAVYEKNDLRRMGASDKLGQLVVEPVEPYHFSTTLDGVRRASHGGLAEAEVPLIIAGAGVRSGARLRQASLTDVAPTICGVLGLAPPATADGRYLREAFRR